MKFTLTKINMLTWNFNGYASIGEKSLLISVFEIICDYHKILSEKLIRKKTIYILDVIGKNEGKLK